MTHPRDVSSMPRGALLERLLEHQGPTSRGNPNVIYDRLVSRTEPHEGTYLTNSHICGFNVEHPAETAGTGVQDVELVSRERAVYGDCPHS